MTGEPPRDHGGGVDAAAERFGGARADWLDLSAGINPVAYPAGAPSPRAWASLPDSGANKAFLAAARGFWRVPEGAGILAAPGASALITRIPALCPTGRVAIAQPTYNEHAAAFRSQGWQVVADAHDADAAVLVHPNNPDGRLWREAGVPPARMTVIDESFCDTVPERSLIGLSDRPGVVVLKSFGKFWGLAGLRLGAAIGDPALLARLAEWLGPWPVSGPALEIGGLALTDRDWAGRTRVRLADDAERLDALMVACGAKVAGGTTLFRLYDVGNAAALHERLCRHRILSRVFPYSDSWLRLGLPGDAAAWARLEAAL